MKKTNRELAEFYGITVGDIVTIYDEGGVVYGVFECKDLDAMCPLRVITCRDICLNSMGIGHIRNRRYEVSKPKKKIGETRCDDYSCESCPLRLLDCEQCGYWDTNWSLYKILNEACASTGMNADHPIYKAFKAELDKEVE